MPFSENPMCRVRGNTPTYERFVACSRVRMLAMLVVFAVFEVFGGRCLRVNSVREGTHHGS